MADYMIKGETLTSIANAIRAKSGSNVTMTPEQMSTEIENISVGGGDIDALIDGSLTEITSNVTNIRESAFYGHPALTSVNLPNATSIGYAVFSNCSKLTSVNLPNATSIGRNAFYYCSTLPSINLPNATSIGTSAFSNCSKLTSVNLPNATSIGLNAFYYCFRLTCLILQNMTVATLGNTNAFSNCYRILGTTNATYNPEGLKDGFIYVPNTLVADYRTATNWSEYSSQIMPWVATVEELANIDGTTYDYACVGEGLGSVEYHYNGTTWEVFR